MAGGLSEKVWSELVGTVAVVDLESACELYGRDLLPYPLGRTRPVGSVWLACREVGPAEERLSDGDLRGIRPWVETLVRAEVCVECRVHHVDEDTPDLRLHGLRAGGDGFVAMQRRDRDGVDVVDIYAVSPESLAVVVTGAAGLVGPGTHPRIAVAGMEDRLPEPPETLDRYDDLGLTMTPAAEEPEVCVVEGRDVVATGTVQVRHDVARQWGVDPDSPLLQWVQVRDDGDYLYEPDDTGCAEPLDAELLNACVDQLIIRG
ncbi:ESX secretion-associated protein EspG [Mycobacterium sp. SMC-8]|uniref:ESX secretion-associated protein EspG n=1 Tax=Mycobacterium sp. SMC-8 TaxID=2857060 RepID=UPI0021B19EF7|nr:ESX secretion-associated protein EspG [Mycobacterium sp. SMC-8]UXA13164.1 ESX secretion-associated protein EspG [Mycobacterium sp. SMC-8]